MAKRTGVNYAQGDGKLDARFAIAWKSSATGKALTERFGMGKDGLRAWAKRLDLKPNRLDYR